MTAGAPLRIGISVCLHGETVRYDGGHKHGPYPRTRQSRGWAESGVRRQRVTVTVRFSAVCNAPSPATARST